MEHEHLGAAELESFETQLQTTIDTITQTLVDAKSSAQIVELDQPIGRLSRMDALQQQQIAKDHVRRMKVQREQCEAALRRLRDDPEDFGYCNLCDEFIGKKRLKAKPESPLCLPCQQGLERR